MTKEPNGTTPELLVIGRDEAGKPRAARFPAGHDSLVAKAAKAMNLAVCKADGGAWLSWRRGYRRAACTRLVVHCPLLAEVYSKLIEQLKRRRTTGAGRNRSDGDQAAPGLPTTWDDIAVGHLVIAEEEGRNRAGGRQSSKPGTATC